MSITRASWSCSFVCLMTLACACDGSSGSNDDANDGTHAGSGGARSHGDAAVDDGGTKSGGSGDEHTHGDAGERAGDSGNAKSDAGDDSHAGNGGHVGASGNDGSGTGGDESDDGDDATGGSGAEDAGSDSGMQDSGTPDPCPSHVMCNAACCAAGQICKTAAGSQINIDWDHDIGGGNMHAVVGSTLRFTFDDSRHDVQLFPNQAAFAACNFTNADLLSDSSPYTWNASTAGDFYFGCSTVSSFGAHCLDDDMKLHVIVDAPTQACAAP